MTETAQTGILWPILAGLLIVLTNAFFVTVEFAVVTVRRGQMDRLAEEGNAGARMVLRLLRDPDWAIAGSQLGITLASILLGIVAEEPLQRLLEPVLVKIVGRVPALAGVATAAAGTVVLLVLSFFHMVLGEQTPKTIALRHPVRAALLIARPMSVFARLAAPLVWVVDHSTAFVLKLMGVGGQTGGHGIHTVEELKDVVRESQEEGVIPSGDEKLLIRAMDFSSRFVREAMIPRPDMIAIEKAATLGEMLRVFKTSRHSRFPVFEDDLDHICGTVTMKEALSILVDNPSALDLSLTELGIIQPALVIPESRHIGDLFNQMRRDQTHMAIIIDEFGGTAGLVTSEQLAEEVVGRLTDEWVTDLPHISPTEDGAFEIDAQSKVDELNETLGLGLPTSPDYETIAGFLLFQIRHIPRPGESIVYHGLHFRVLQMEGHKIERIRLERERRPPHPATRQLD